MQTPTFHPEIEICLSPELLHLFPLENKTVVVADILRATSCMVTALEHGVSGIIPVATLDECAAWKAQGYLTAAERDGKKVEGFDLDNSPFSYQNPGLSGKEIVMTTTNGTLAITKSVKAKEILIGSFLNLNALATYLTGQKYNVLVVCAGWKGNVSREDTLFGGALAYALAGSHAVLQDAMRIALDTYTAHKNNMLEYLQDCQHVKRLAKLHITKDVAYCLTESICQVIPVYASGIIEPLKLQKLS